MWQKKIAWVPRLTQFLVVCLAKCITQTTYHAVLTHTVCPLQFCDFSLESGPTPTQQADSLFIHYLPGMLGRYFIVDSFQHFSDFFLAGKWFLLPFTTLFSALFANISLSSLRKIGFSFNVKELKISMNVKESFG